MMSKRAATSSDVEAEVLIKSARRCALCYYLLGDLTEKLGQIAHIDKNPAHGMEDNLAFLCMEHHTLYDSRTSQHKNYTEAELRRARVDLYAAIVAKQHFNQPAPPKSRRRKKPKLNIVYQIGQCAWSVGGQLQPDGKMKKMMQISFWATFTTDGAEPVLILESYPEGTEPIMSGFVHRIEPRRLNRIMISAFVLPIFGTPGQPVKARFILKDQYGRTYLTPKTEFRFIPSGIEKLPD
jgi:hypothetical protein